jgi:hypothetical protein
MKMFGGEGEGVEVKPNQPCPHRRTTLSYIAYDYNVLSLKIKFKICNFIILFASERGPVIMHEIITVEYLNMASFRYAGFLGFLHLPEY